MFKYSELDKNKFFPEVLQVRPTDEFEIYSYFNDGSIHYYDMKPLIIRGTVFEKLKDVNVFRENICIENNTVAWNIDGIGIVDLDPFVLFDTKPVKEPEFE